MRCENLDQQGKHPWETRKRSAARSRRYSAAAGAVSSPHRAPRRPLPGAATPPPPPPAASPASDLKRTTLGPHPPPGPPVSFRISRGDTAGQPHLFASWHAPSLLRINRAVNLPKCSRAAFPLFDFWQRPRHRVDGKNRLESTRMESGGGHLRLRAFLQKART